MQYLSNSCHIYLAHTIILSFTFPNILIFVLVGVNLLGCNVLAVWPFGSFDTADEGGSERQVIIYVSAKA